jgi:hypothetical protein
MRVAAASAPWNTGCKAAAGVVCAKLGGGGVEGKGQRPTAGTLSVAACNPAGLPTEFEAAGGKIM